MRNTQYFRTFALCTVTTFAPAALLLAQTGPGATTQTSPTPATSSTAASSQMRNDAMQNSMDAGNGTNGANGPMADKMFLHKASEGGMAEVQLGQLASQKAGSDDVKKFGQQMVEDHTKLNNQLQPFADSLGVKPPKKISKGDQSEYDKLNAMSGDDFDKEFLAYMVKDHHKDLHEFKQEESTTTNTNLKTVVSQGEQVIQQHLSMVTDLAKQKGVPVKGGSDSGQ